MNNKNVMNENTKENVVTIAIEAYKIWYVMSGSSAYSHRLFNTIRYSTFVYAGKTSSILYWINNVNSKHIHFCWATFDSYHTSVSWYIYVGYSLFTAMQFCHRSYRNGIDSWLADITTTTKNTLQIKLFFSVDISINYPT